MPDEEMLYPDSPPDEGREESVEFLMVDEEHLYHRADTIPKATKHAMSTTDAPMAKPVIMDVSSRLSQYLASGLTFLTSLFVTSFFAPKTFTVFLMLAIRLCY